MARDAAAPFDTVVVLMMGTVPSGDREVPYRMVKRCSPPPRSHGSPTRRCGMQRHRPCA